MRVDDYKIRPSKHFVLGWMRKWDYDIPMIKSSLKRAYWIEKVGNEKYEAYFRHKGKSRKLIFVKNDSRKEIFIITGAQGK